MNKKELYETIMKDVSKTVKSKLLESVNTNDIVYYIIYNDYNHSYNIYTSLTPGIDDILNNADPDSVEEYESYSDLKNEINDYEYDYVYDKWGDNYTNKSKYYILYDEYNNKFLFQTIEGLNVIGYSIFPIIYQADDLDLIIKTYNELTK